jgi:hypothetical protein
MDRIEELRTRSGDTHGRDEGPSNTEAVAAMLGEQEEPLGDRLLRVLQEKLAEADGHRPEVGRSDDERSIMP